MPAKRTLLIGDARGTDRHLRVTWHGDEGQFTVSTWHGDVCGGAVRVDPADVPRLLAALALGLAEAEADAAAESHAHRHAGHGAA